MKVCVVLTARPSWAKLSTVCAALKRRPEVELQIVVCASALLERYGAVVHVVKAEGHEITAECWTTLEGETLNTSVRETGYLAAELGSVLSRLRPDVVAVVADRHEILAVAQAAAYMHIPLLHMQGGEKSSSIDSKVRDAVSALADYHAVCTKRAMMRVYGLTGDADKIWVTGCPSIDLAKQALSEPPVTADELGGAGVPLDPAYPFLLVLQHPVTDQADEAYEQMRITLEACGRVNLPRLVMWPGQDAGAGTMSKAIREWIADHPEQSWHTVRNLPPNRFLRLLTQAACLVGNSSAGIRECSYLGVPVVNVGTRQHGRERGPNVMDVPHVIRDITAAIQEQLVHGPYPSAGLYGKGDSGERIAEVLCGLRQFVGV